MTLQGGNIHNIFRQLNKAIEHHSTAFLHFQKNNFEIRYLIREISEKISELNIIISLNVGLVLTVDKV